MLTVRSCVLLSAVVLAFLAGPGRSRVPAPDAEPLLRWSVPAERAECPVGDTAVWTRYRGGGDCIRYFVGGKLERAPVAMIFFRGDRRGWIQRDLAAIPRNTARAQQAYAAGLSERLGLPVIIVARPGTFGSSGNHLHRRQAAEFLALDGALDEIRSRYQIGRFVLVGQSGGATAVAALLTLGRTDISCAVLTSGAYDLLERAEFLRKQNGYRSRPGHDTTGLPHPYDPLEHVNGIARDVRRLITIIGSPEDRLTPFRYQKKFADAVRAKGHRVHLMEHAAPPPFHHSLDRVGMEAGAKCATGELPREASDALSGAGPDELPGVP